MNLILPRKKLKDKIFFERTAVKPNEVALRFSSVVACLPSMCEALRPSPRTEGERINEMSV